jgi:hypothetical protein
MTGHGSRSYGSYSLRRPSVPAGAIFCEGAALVPRSIRPGTFCSCFGSLGEAIIIGGNTEHRLLGRFVVHLIREGVRGRGCNMR